MNEDEFKALIDSMGLLEESSDEMEKLLHTVDPFNNQKMTYSEIVALLSQHMVPASADSEGDQQMIPMLEKFVNADLDSSHQMHEDSQYYNGGNQLEESEVHALQDSHQH